MLLVLLELVCYSQYLVAIHFFSSPCFYLSSEKLNIFMTVDIIFPITVQDDDIKKWTPSVDRLVSVSLIKPLLPCQYCILLAVLAVSKHLVAYTWGSKNGDNRSIVTYKASTDIADDPPGRRQSVEARHWQWNTKYFDRVSKSNFSKFFKSSELGLAISANQSATSDYQMKTVLSKIDITHIAIKFLASRSRQTIHKRQWFLKLFFNKSPSSCLQNWKQTVSFIIPHWFQCWVNVQSI